MTVDPRPPWVHGRRVLRLFFCLRIGGPSIQRDLLRTDDGYDHKIRPAALGLEWASLAGELLPGTPREASGVSQTAPPVAAAGRPVPVKDVPTLLVAMRTIGQARPDARSAVVVGDGAERPSLEDQRIRLGLPDRADGRGWQSDAARVVGDLSRGVGALGQGLFAKTAPGDCPHAA